jgi:hypothetical protein
VGRTTRAFVILCCLALCVTTVLGSGGAPVAAKVPAPIPSASRPAAVLTVISGAVELRAAGTAFAPALDGAVIYVGSTVRTSADARAVLTLFEGSTVELEPASDITIEEATSRGGSTIVELAQSLGRSWHVVTHLTTPDSRYEVKTPAATASVRGTAFEVALVDGPSGSTTTVTTVEGLVATSDAAAVSTVLVGPDQMTTVRANALPEPPRSAPAAQRVVTVSAPSESSIVVDPLGRANGMRDGKVVAQTPGARVRMEGGTIVVTLPNVPEGVFATTIADGATVPVSMTVVDQGEDPVSVTTAAIGGAAGVELRRAGDKTELRALDADETRKLGSDKTGLRKNDVRASAEPASGGPVDVRPTQRSIMTPTKKTDGTPRSAATPRRSAVVSPSPSRR